MEAKYKKGDMVSFFRNNSIKAEATEIISVVPILSQSRFEKVEQNYVIENEQGWTPNNIRARELNLDLGKKYIFVSEKELKAVE